jgi:predicted permease
MGWLGRLTGGLNALVRKRRVERELDEELRGYLDAAIEEKTRRGLPRAEALRAARAEMGSLDAVKDYTRDVGWEAWVEGVWRDGRYAVRTLRRSPGFTAVAVLTLSLGIGATTAIFSLLDTVIFKSLPVRNPEELVLVGGSQYPVFQAFRRHTDLFVDLCATSGVTPLDVEVQSGVKERTAVSLVSGSYFSTLGVQAAIGRALTVDQDGTPGAHPVAVASDRYWQRRFGGDPGILDRVVRISGTPISIIGVAPPGFFGEEVGVAPDLWVPLTMWGDVVPGRNLLQSPGTGWLRIIGRVPRGAPISGVQPTLTETFRQVLAEIFGPNMPQDVRRDTANANIRIEPAGRGLSSLRAQFMRPLQLMMGAVAVVLLIACANIANLLLARATARRREIDVRLALGMSRGRLFRQLLTESFVLAALGTGAGIGVAWLGREALLRLISADGSRLPVAVETDARLLLFVALMASVTTVLVGLAPAWHSARVSRVSSLGARRDGGGQPTGKLNSLMVVAQVALSLVLLTGAGLFLRTLANLRAIDLGFAPERLVVIDVHPQAAGYSGERAIALGRSLLERFRAVPGVSAVSLSEHGVLTGTTNGTNRLHPPGLAAGPDGFPQTRWDVVGPRYFSTMGTRLISGRDFSEEDRVGSPQVVAINEQMQRLFFPGVDPIGRQLVWGLGSESKPLEIVAVAADVKQSGPREGPQPRFYVPYLQMPQLRPAWALASTRFLVRTVASPGALAAVLRQQVAAQDPRLSVASLDIGPELVSRTLVRERMIAILLVGFGVLAVCLACVGVYGLIAYHVAQRTSEIGIRMALGARGTDVLRATLRRAALWTSTGVVLGVPLAMSASRLAQSLLFGLTGADTSALIGAAGLMIALGLVAAYIPARRASRVDPLVALRAD